MKKIVFFTSALIASGVFLTVNSLGSLANIPATQETPTQLPASDVRVQLPVLLAQASQPTTAAEFFAELNLRDGQKQQILAIFEEYQPSIDAAQAELKTEAQRLGEVLQPTTPEAEIRVYRTNLVQLSESYSELVFERNMAIRNVLDIEQRAKINQLIRAILDDES